MIIIKEYLWFLIKNKNYVQKYGEINDEMFKIRRNVKNEIN